MIVPPHLPIPVYTSALGTGIGTMCAFANKNKRSVTTKTKSIDSIAQERNSTQNNLFNAQD